MISADLDIETFFYQYVSHVIECLCAQRQSIRIFRTELLNFFKVREIMFNIIDKDSIRNC